MPQPQCPHCTGFKVERIAWVDKATGKPLYNPGCLLAIILYVASAVCGMGIFAGGAAASAVGGEGNLFGTLGGLIGIIGALVPLALSTWWWLSQRNRFSKADKVEKYSCSSCGKEWRADEASA